MTTIVLNCLSNYHFLELVHGLLDRFVLGRMGHSSPAGLMIIIVK